MVPDDRGTQPLRLMIFDRTCRGRPLRPGLSHAWGAGGHLYRWLRRFDGWKGIASWEEGLHWLATFRPERPIAEVQYWGHGKWGLARVDRQCLGVEALRPRHTLRPALMRVRDRMLPADQGLWWFRTCETFGARAGHRFAGAFSDFLGCRAAGHTYIIGHWQSGLHSLGPGEEPGWPDDEALVDGTPDDPERASWSTRSAPNTITFLHGQVPAGY